MGLPYCGPNQRSCTTLSGLELSRALSLPPFPSPSVLELSRAPSLRSSVEPSPSRLIPPSLGWGSLEPLPCLPSLPGLCFPEPPSLRSLSPGLAVLELSRAPLFFSILRWSRTDKKHARACSDGLCAELTAGTSTNTVALCLAEEQAQWPQAQN